MCRRLLTRARGRARACVKLRVIQLASELLLRTTSARAMGVSLPVNCGSYSCSVQFQVVLACPAQGSLTQP